MVRLGNTIVTGKTVTRADLSATVYEKMNLSRSECSALVELVLKEITHTLEKGEAVKLSSFGCFLVRKKGQRVGRNPSAILKQRMNEKQSNSRTPSMAEIGSSAPGSLR
jgi:nucleoid DNA-binding protein